MENIPKKKGNWSQTKAKLKSKFLLFSDNDLSILNGNQEDIMKRLQLRLGKTKEELQQIISNL